MLDTITHTFHSLFLSFALSALFAPILISLLYQTKQVVGYKKEKLGSGMGGDNKVFLKYHYGKNGTPNIGGILIWLIVPITLLIMQPFSYFRMVVIIAFILFGGWGLLDVVMTNRIKNNPELKTYQEKFGVRLFRFGASVPISMIVLYLANRYDLLTTVDLTFVTLSVTLLSMLLLSLIAQFAVYSAEITDGLDGLMIGIFMIIYIALGALLFIQGQYSYLPLIGIIIGSSMVDLYFNIYPARFFNGGPSTMPLGFIAFFLSLISGNLIAYFIISSVTWGIMFSSMIQIISIRFFKKRVFKIAPLHHHFQAVGWPEAKVTTRFWLATMVVAVIGIYVGIVL